MAETTDFNDFATEHPNYFPGQYLLEDDFKLQHKYLSDRLRYQNKSLHVSGIIEGLEVTFTEDKKKVKIQSGSAIDSQGNLIVLKEEKTKDIPDGGGELYIEFSHQENEKTKQQKKNKNSFTRWKEEPIVEFKNTTPENAVKLAKLTISGEEVTLDVEERQYSGISLPSSNGEALTLRSGGNANPKLAVFTGSLEIQGDLTVNGTLTVKEFTSQTFGDSDGVVPTEKAVKNYINTQTQTLENKINQLENKSIPQVTTDSNFKANDGAVPTVGAVYGYIKNISKFFPPKKTLVFDLDDQTFLEMVYIPGGSFIMGSSEGEDNEMPQHIVTVPPFYMGKYPVTQAQWIAVMGDNPSHFQGDDFSDHLNYPVERVSWNDCYGNQDNFCHRLTEKLTSLGIGEFRLPSEAEWEYACRAGTTTEYYFGDDENNLSEYAWYKGNSAEKTHPVGQKKPNNFELYDMYGNVWEWSADYWHDNYQDAPNDGSAWKSPNSKYRVVRGGSCHNIPSLCRSANRPNNNLEGGSISIVIGFRVVCMLPRTL